MPDKPLWYSRLNEAIEQLDALPSPWVDRATIEFVLRVGRRRAQQILRPLVRQTIGRNGLAQRDEVIQHLRRVAVGDTVYYEKRRRERLRSILDQLHQDVITRPQVLVEAPVSITRQEIEALPAGVELSPGRIVIEGFRNAEEALQKLLALAMAVGNDPVAFQDKISVEP
jgi:hypothetical protein